MDASARGSRAALLLLLRIAGAGLLGAMAWIHLYLWDDGYRNIDRIGPLFLLDAVAGAGLGLAVLLAPRRWLPAAAGLGALLQAGTLGGLAVSVQVGLFGFVESTRAELFWPSVWVEAAGVVLLVVLALLARIPRRPGVRPRAGTGVDRAGVR